MHTILNIKKQVFISNLLRVGIFLSTVFLTFESSAQDKLYHNEFSLADVTLLDGPFKHARDLNIQTLLKYDVDRLLAGYRKEAGLPEKAKSQRTGSAGFVGAIAPLVLQRLVAVFVGRLAEFLLHLAGILFEIALELLRMVVGGLADAFLHGALGFAQGTLLGIHVVVHLCTPYVPHGGSGYGQSTCARVGGW